MLFAGNVAGDSTSNTIDQPKSASKEISNQQSPPAPYLFPNDKNIPEIAPVKLPPEIFPEDTEKFKIVPPCNNTALKILRGQTEQTPKEVNINKLY